MASSSLSALILSDAHLGWTDPTQPTPSVQLAAVRALQRQFPAPDLLIDTGDAHHGGLEIGAAEAARRDWTGMVSNGFPQLPLLYVPGNHEMLDFRGEDAEWRSCRLGSLGLRPYWSFDFRGIHFVSVPQMRRVNLVNREVLEWLAFDLDRHRHMTTILLAHQALLGTTYNNGELDYRAMVNSDAVFALLDQNPQVKAWMHGHNHTFEVVKRERRLYVSNGRIGGFIPPLEWGDFGQPHLGAVVLEIEPNWVRVRCFNASLGRFFEQANLRGELQTRTTLDANAPTRATLGLGLAAGGDHRPFNRHFAARGGLELSARRARERALNDDPELRLSCPLWGDRASKRIERGEQPAVLIHSLVLAPAHVWESSREGLSLVSKANVPNQAITLLCPGRAEQKIPYFAVMHGARYRLLIAIHASEPVLLTPTLLLREQAQDDPEALALEPRFIAAAEREIHLDFPIELDTAQGATLLLGLSLQLQSEAALIKIARIELYRLPSPNAAPLVLALPGCQPIALNPTGFATQQKSIVRGQTELESGVMQLSGGDGWPMTLSLALAGCDFQVRQAQVQDQGDHLDIGPMTSPWSPAAQICIARLIAADTPFLCATRGVTRLRVFPLERGNRSLRVEIFERGKHAELVLYAPQALTATGAKWLRSEGMQQVYEAIDASVEFGLTLA